MAYDHNNMAYDHNNMHNSSNPASLDWDFHYNIDMVMEDDNSTPSDSDVSTGYLQDALIEWRNQSKRRRLLFHGNDRIDTASEDCLRDYYWDCNRDNSSSENFNCLNQILNFNNVSDEGLNSSVSSISIDDEMTFSEIIKAPENQLSVPKTLLDSTSSYEESSKKFSSGGHHGGGKNKLAMTKVVYPFELVKPGGIEGDVTLNDINERILMPPTRPVKHPVGDYACRPCLLPEGSSGLSGKAVVAFTRIHTQGRGTITIVRTKG